MTAPESSPKPAEAIAPGFSPWTKESAEACLITTDGNGKENKRRALRFLIKQATEAAIQRGDGQTKALAIWERDRALGNADLHTAREMAAALSGETPPAAKPNETSGATPIVATVSPGEKPMSAETGTAIKEMVTLAAMQVQLSGADKALEIERAHVARLQAELNAVRAAGAEGKAMSDLAGMTKLELVARCFNLQLKLDRDAAKSTPGESGLSALDFTRLRDWFADPQRKPAILAFTAGPARDAAAAFESAKSTPGVAEALRDATEILEGVIPRIPGMSPFLKRDAQAVLAKLRAVKQEQIGGAT